MWTEFAIWAKARSNSGWMKQFFSFGGLGLALPSSQFLAMAAHGDILFLIFVPRLDGQPLSHSSVFNLAELGSCHMLLFFSIAHVILQIQLAVPFM